MKVSIRGVIITGIIILIWGTLLISTPFSYISNKKVMMVHTMDVMENISDLTVKQTRNFFATARGAARLTKSLISSKVLYTDRDHIEKLEKYFLDQLELYPQFAGIYFANPDGEFYYVKRSEKIVSDGYRTKCIQMTPQGRTADLVYRDREMRILEQTTVPDDPYDPRVRPWYVKAIKEKQVIWTSPYIFFSSKKPGITTAGPIYDNGRLVGVVGVDIELDMLSNFIGSLRVGKTGVAFMIDQDKNVIAYPDIEALKFRTGSASNDIRLPKIDELSNPVCRLALDAVEAENASPPSQDKESAYAAFSNGSEKYYTMFTPVRESKISWMIGVYIPEKDYFGKLISNHRINLLLVLILSCIATGIGVHLAKKIITPISELDLEAQRIANNDYTPGKKIRTPFVEIQRTADTFENMKSSVLAYRNRLRREKQIHGAITETANDAILMIDDTHTVTYWNAAAGQIFQYAGTDTLGKRIYDLVPFNAAPSPGTLSRVLRDGSKDPCPRNEELYMRNRQGRQYYVEISIVNISIEDRQYTISVIHDITKRKRLEDDKIKTLKQLQQAQKMEALGLLAGGVAHDLNNVLSGLVSYPELLLLDLPEKSPFRDAITTIKDSGKKAASIVDDLLTLARRNVPSIKLINLNRIISTYIRSPEHLNLTRCHKNVAVRTSLAPGLLNIKGSEIHLNKTIMNLVSNAAEAIKDNGTIRITTENTYLDSPVSGYGSVREGEYVRLTVTDTGTGIAPEDLKRIFEPFYTSKVMDRSGTGLGMSVVWGAVQDHDGYIDVDSKPGGGTRFSLYFPSTRQATPPPDAAPDIDEYSGSGETVLIIDDVIEQRKIASTLLTRLNYRVTTAASGEEAFTYLEKQAVDILVIDMIMTPGMDGLDTYKKILEIRPGQRAIIASGFSDDDRVREAQRLGAGEYVKKPYTPENIGRALKNELMKGCAAGPAGGASRTLPKQ